MDDKRKTAAAAYMPMGMGAGIATGVALGIAVDNIGMGLCLGVAWRGVAWRSVPVSGLSGGR